MEVKEEMLGYYTKKIDEVAQKVYSEIQEIQQAFNKKKTKVEGIVGFHSFLTDKGYYFKPSYIISKKSLFGVRCMMLYPKSQGKWFKYTERAVDYDEAIVTICIKDKEEYIGFMLILWFISHYYTSDSDKFNYFCGFATTKQPSEKMVELYEDVVIKLKTLTHIGKFPEHLISCAFNVAVVLVRTQILEYMDISDSDGFSYTAKIEWEDNNSVDSKVKECIAGYLNKLQGISPSLEIVSE